MLIPSTDLSQLFQIAIQHGKLIATAIGGIITANKAFQWIKEIRTKDLSNLNVIMTALTEKVDAQTKSINDRVDSQTIAVVGELREMRNDFRTFYSPTQIVQPLSSIAPLVMTPARAAQKRVIKSATKAKRKAKITKSKPKSKSKTRVELTLD